MSSKESTTTNSSDGAGTHHSRDNSVPSAIYEKLQPQNKLQKFRKTSLPTYGSPSLRSRSSGGSSLGSSVSQRPMTVTYKSVTTSGMLFKKKTTSVDCGVFIKDPG